MYLIYIINLIFISCSIVTIQCADNTKLSDKRSCANKECSVPISEGKTSLRFSSPTEGVLSFRTNQHVTIYSKDAGKNTNLWGAEIDGKRGYVPKRFIRESKILFTGPLRFLENVEEVLNTKESFHIKPDSVKEPYEVIDGTTVYSANSSDNIEISNDQILSADASLQVKSEENSHLDNDSIKKLDISDSDEKHHESIKTNLNTESKLEFITKLGTENSDIPENSNIPENIKDSVNEEEKLNNHIETMINLENMVGDKNKDNKIAEEIINKDTEIDFKEKQVSFNPYDSLKNTIANNIPENLQENPLNESINSPNLNEKETKFEQNKTPEEITQTINLSSEIAETITEHLDSSLENSGFNQPSENNEKAVLDDFDYDLKLDNFSAETDFESNLIDSNESIIDNNSLDLSKETDKTDLPEEAQLEDFSEESDQTVDEFIDEKKEEENSHNTENIIDINSVREEVSSTENLVEEPEEGFFSKIFSDMFGHTNKAEENINNHNKQNIYDEQKSSLYEETGTDYLMSNIDHSTCSSSSELTNNCHFTSESLKQTDNFPTIEDISNSLTEFDLASFYDIILVLSITGGTTVVFFLGYLLIDKYRREGPLINRINQLEKALLVARKENVLLAEKSASESKSNENQQEIEQLQAELEKSLIEQANLQEQTQSLEKELENSTEVGLELNKMISDMLTSQNGGDILNSLIEQLQNQLVDQHNDIAKYKEKLNEKTTENHELQLEFEINKKKINDLQTEIDTMLLNVLKVEEERDDNQQKYEASLADLNKKLHQNDFKKTTEIQRLNSELQKTNKLSADLNRNYEIKSKEFDLLKDSIKEVKAMKNNSETLKSLLDVSSVKAELHQLKTDNLTLNENLQIEQQKAYTFEKQTEIAIQEAQLLKVRFDEADKEKLAAQTKLTVLGCYFKEKENQLQKELTKHEAMWNEKQGEASSTVERIKFMQEELQNYKSQNETLKQEIMSQEVELKSQISVLEKRSHEFWLNSRQLERKLEDAKQEAAQLRNRLTLQERAYMDDKSNGIMQPMSPLHHMGADGGLIAGPESTVSPPPPLMYGHRDHMTTSPHNLHSLPPPPPFLPPPPFMPPPPMNGPPPPMFMHPMPPPPLTQGTGVGMFGPPGDHRPPPLGRISSPPIPDRARDRPGVCYSPSSSTIRTYSPYDDARHSPPSPTYDDDDDEDLEDMYSRRGRYYHPNNYPRHIDSPPTHAKNGNKGSNISSGASGNSNTSAEKTSSAQYRHNTNV